MTNANQIRRFINQEMTQHQVVVFAKSYCPHCAATRNLLRTIAGIDLVVHELDQIAIGDKIQQELVALTGQRTVPSIFINSKHIGGNSDLQQLRAYGLLGAMLQKFTTMDEISATIEKHHVVVYAKSYCPHCAATRQLLASMPELDVKIVELDVRSDGADMQDVLEKLTGQHTVPNVFISGKHIGGNSDLQLLHKSGRLPTLLAQAVGQLSRDGTTNAIAVYGYRMVL